MVLVKIIKFIKWNRERNTTKKDGKKNAIKRTTPGKLHFSMIFKCSNLHMWISPRTYTHTHTKPLWGKKRVQKKNNWDEAQNRQFSMRLTLVVIYSFIFKPLGFHFFRSLSSSLTLCIHFSMLFQMVGVVVVVDRHCLSFLLRFVRFRLIFEFN